MSIKNPAHLAVRKLKAQAKSLLGRQGKIKTIVMQLINSTNSGESDFQSIKEKIQQLGELVTGAEENTENTPPKDSQNKDNKDEELQKLTEHLAKVKQKAYHRKHFVIKNLEDKVLELKEKLRTGQGYSSEEVLQLQQELKEKGDELKDLTTKLANKEAKIKHLEEIEIKDLKTKIKESSGAKGLSKLEEEILIKFQEVIDSFSSELVSDFTDEEFENALRTFEGKVDSLDLLWKEDKTPNLLTLIKKESVFKLLDKYRGLVYEKKSLQKRLEEGDDNVTELEKSLKEFETQYRETDNLLYIANNEKDILEKQVGLFKDKSSEFIDKIKELEKLLDSKDKLLEDLEQEKEALLDEKKRLEDQLYDARTESDRKDRKIHELEEKISELDTKISSLEEKTDTLIELEREKRTLSEEKTKLEGQLEAERQIYAGRQEKVVELETRIHNLNTQITNNQNSWNQERNNLNNQISSLSSQLSNARVDASRASGLQSQVYSLQNETERLRRNDIDNFTEKYCYIFINFSHHWQKKTFIAAWNGGQTIQHSLETSSSNWFSSPITNVSVKGEYVIYRRPSSHSSMFEIRPPR